MTKGGWVSTSTTFQIFVVVAVPLLCLVPFVTKAFHIDDTLFLWAAKHIVEHPFDFYGFSANWYGHEMPMFEITMNPPLVSYYLAAAGFLFGWSELALHIAFLIPAVAASLGSYYLARPLCSRPHVAVLIAVLTPAFLVSSTNIMADTMMLAFYVWAAGLWLHGLRDNSLWRLLASAAFILLASLTKYFGITLVPLLFLYSVLSRRALGGWVFVLALPLVALLGYQGLTYRLYGRGLLWNSASYSLLVRHEIERPWLATALTGLAFTGGCLAAVGFYAPLLWPRRLWALGGVGVIAMTVAILAGLGAVGKVEFRDAEGIRWGLLLQLALFIVAGLHVLGLAAVDVWAHRDAASWLLFSWIVGTLLFASLVNWSANARTILPMAPAVGILVMRRYSRRIKISSAALPWHAVLPLLPAAALAVAVAWADHSLANSHRAAARDIQTQAAGFPLTVWFEGHWGFQYYMESGGAQAVDHDARVPQAGDLLVLPLNNTNVYVPRGVALHFLDRRLLITCPWMATMDVPLGAGFYSDLRGPLPFAFGVPHPEEFDLFLVGSLEGTPEIAREFRESFRTGAHQPNAYVGLRAVLAARQEAARAIASARQALTTDPRNPALHVRLGSLYVRSGELAAASEQYRQALLLVPDSPEIHGNLGALLERRGRVEEALYHYLRALELQPDSAQTHTSLGRLFAEQGRLSEALHHFSEALRIGPDSVDGHTALAGLFFRQRKFTEAIGHYEKALELNPDSAEVHNNLGVTLACAQRFQEAVAHLSEALRLRPDYSEASENLKGVLSEAGELHPPPDSQTK
jgi:Tfp pilus assembly protein PilF/4-amino-4-deoxy-L-arabinose transferase-like glycosyltransferase